MAQKSLIFLLALCPALVVATSMTNGLAMGLMTAFVLLCSSVILFMLRKFIPDEIRTAASVVVIATLVTLADLFMAGVFSDIREALGVFVPLMIVNCLILDRARSFAGFADTLGISAGFILTLTVLGTIREVIGNGSLFGIMRFEPWVVMVLPAGAFMILGFTIAAVNVLRRGK